MIDDKDPSVRLQASCAAWTLGRSKRAIHEATALLDNPDKTIRAYAAMLIEDMGEDAASAAPKLVDRLSEPDEIILLCVVKALDKVGHAALEPLLRKTKSPNARVRALAIACLDDMKVADRRVHEAFVAALSDADWDVRESAVGAVRKSKIRGPLVTERLITLLGDPEDMVCVAAAKALAENGEKKAIPAIEKAIMNRRMSSDKEALAYCLGKLNAVSAIPTLEKMLQKTEMQDGDSVTDRPVRVAIVTALGHMGPAAIPALERAKSDPEQSVREAAADSLQRILSEMKSESTASPTAGECERCRLRGCRWCCADPCGL